ncbi:MAG: hypothetical protein K5839_06985 [Treponemataceae bacterium]|nr:hypothetical protein [Treponemataceae bacterium]
MKKIKLSIFIVLALLSTSFVFGQTFRKFDPRILTGEAIIPENLITIPAVSKINFSSSSYSSGYYGRSYGRNTYGFERSGNNGVWESTETDSVVLDIGSYSMVYRKDRSNFKIELLPSLSSFEISKDNVRSDFWNRVAAAALKMDYSHIKACDTTYVNASIGEIICWLNALSEMNNLTPVYTDDKGQVLRDAKKMRNGVNENLKANGYRLPNIKELLCITTNSFAENPKTFDGAGFPSNMFGVSGVSKYGNDIYHCPIAEFAGPIMRNRSSSDCVVFDLTNCHNSKVTESNKSGYFHIAKTIE